MQREERALRTIIGGYDGNSVAASGPVIRKVGQNFLRACRGKVGNTEEDFQLGLPGA